MTIINRTSLRIRGTRWRNCRSRAGYPDGSPCSFSTLRAFAETEDAGIHESCNRSRTVGAVPGFRILVSLAGAVPPSHGRAGHLCQGESTSFLPTFARPHRCLYGKNRSASHCTNPKSRRVRRVFAKVSWFSLSSPKSCDFCVGP